MKSDDCDDRRILLGRMQSICSKAEKCEEDIRFKMRDYPISAADREWILTRLRDDKFINDRRFAGFFVRDRFRFNKWGRMKIRHALQMKKINDEIIDDAIREIDPEEYVKMAEEILSVKSISIQDKSIGVRKAKLFRFATQKGFEQDLVYNMIENMIKND